MLMRKRGQSTLEYAILTVAIVAALMGIRIYMKRGLEGKLADSSNQLGEQFEVGKTKVISDKKHTGVTVQSVANRETKVTTGGGQDPSGNELPDKRLDSGSETVGGL